MNTQSMNKKSNPVAKAMITLYGVVCYLLFFPTFCYFIAFTGGIPVPKTVDTGVNTPLLQAHLINIGLIITFGEQYLNYKKEVPKFIPDLKGRGKVVQKPVVR